MARIDFYHLTRFRLERALPLLLSRVFLSGKRAVVVAGSEERVEELAVLLWSDRDGWLPHGTIRDGHAADQPIWLTDNPEENPNQASILVLCDGMDSPQSATLDRTLDLFDGSDPDSLQAARQRWKRALESGHVLHYWQQGEDGRWVEKATSAVR